MNSGAQITHQKQTLSACLLGFPLRRIVLPSWCCDKANLRDRVYLSSWFKVQSTVVGKPRLQLEAGGWLYTSMHPYLGSRVVAPLGPQPSSHRLPKFSDALGGTLQVLCLPLESHSHSRVRDRRGRAVSHRDTEGWGGQDLLQLWTSLLHILSLGEAVARNVAST